MERRLTDLTTYTLKIDGEKLPTSYVIISIDITREINRIPRAVLVLVDGDSAQQDFEASSGEHFTPGKTLVIEVGYHLQETQLFKGIITGQRIQVKRGNTSQLHIELRDPAFRMTLDRKSAYFTEMTDSDLFDELIGKYPDLSSEITDTNIQNPEIVQYQVSDWDFMVSRAENLGLFCLADDSVLKIGKPDLEQDIAHSLSYGSNIYDLDLEIDARTQYQKVNVSAWDPANQERISTESEDVPTPQQGNLSGPKLADVSGVEQYELRHSGTLTQGQIDAWAEAGMRKSRFSRIRGTVSFQGNEAVKPGCLIALKGLGERFNGTAFVSAVRHTLSGRDWITSAQLGMRPTWHHEDFPVNAPPGAGFQPAINGLHTGIVTQLQDDPEGEDRILVKLPAINADEEGVWSRISRLDAGNERGAFFLPEIGDEVVVGFINDDPNEAVVLGMFNSSNKPAPLTASDDNHEKGFVTRSGIKVLFDDSASSLRMTTPKGNTIALDDDSGSIKISDENGSTLTMDSSGISLESPMDIQIKAKGNVSIEGTNVQIEANAAASLEGSASAALKSSGTTDVKGAIVQIN